MSGFNSSYMHGKYTFQLELFGHTHDYYIEVGRSREWEQPEIKTIIGMFFDSKFTGMTIEDWMDPENETPWRFVFKGSTVSHSRFVSLLSEWLGEKDFVKFIHDLEENKRWETPFAETYWQRDTAQF